MNKKLTYRILTGLVIVGFYFLNKYIDNNKKNETYNLKKTPNSITKTFLLPKSTTGYVVHHKYYSLSYSEKHEQAEWVAYELKKNHLSFNKLKRPYFIQDKSITTKSADWRNYKNSGFDKGHLCPAGDRKFSKEAYNETFLTSNITPQNHEFNAGIWNRLEQKTRQWANKYNNVFIITSGVLNNKLSSIGKEKVSVPKKYYKIIYNEKNNQIIAFLIPHKESKKPLHEFVVSVDSIEKITNIDFFTKLDDEKEKYLESKINLKDWGF